jgi:hypothetical protein
MGCASSSPTLVNGGGPGGLVENAKTVASDVMNTGENAMNGKQKKMNYVLLSLYVYSRLFLMKKESWQ